MSNKEAWVVTVIFILVVVGFMGLGVYSALSSGAGPRQSLYCTDVTGGGAPIHITDKKRWYLSRGVFTGGNAGGQYTYNPPLGYICEIRTAVEVTKE